jgi:hypothetical protein
LHGAKDTCVMLRPCYYLTSLLERQMCISEQIIVRQSDTRHCKIQNMKILRACVK